MIGFLLSFSSSLWKNSEFFLTWNSEKKKRGDAFLSLSFSLSLSRSLSLFLSLSFSLSLFLSLSHTLFLSLSSTTSQSIRKCIFVFEKIISGKKFEMGKCKNWAKTEMPRIAVTYIHAHIDLHTYRHTYIHIHIDPQTNRRKKECRHWQRIKMKQRDRKKDRLDTTD